jgi:hypothetical protein
MELPPINARIRRKRILPGGLDRARATLHRASLAVEGYAPIAAVIVILLIVLATLPGLRW